MFQVLQAGLIRALLVGDDRNRGRLWEPEADQRDARVVVPVHGQVAEVLHHPLRAVAVLLRHEQLWIAPDETGVEVPAEEVRVPHHLVITAVPFLVIFWEDNEISGKLVHVTASDFSDLMSSKLQGAKRFW
jgi:hypothetical protein